jgi:hypothetical protein
MTVLLNGGEGAVKRSREGIYFSRQVDAVLVQGNLKLKLTHRTGGLELYDLGKDLSELNDLSENRPEITKRMYHELKEWMDVNDVLTPSPQAPRGRRKK